MRLVDLLIEKNDKSPQGRLGKLSGNKNFQPQQLDYDRIGKSNFLRQAEELEKMGLLTVKWYDGKSEILNIRYNMDSMPVLYEMTGKVRPQELLADYYSRVKNELPKLQKNWIAAYYQSLLIQLEKGNIPLNLKKSEFLECMKGLDSLNEPTYKRIFSAKFLSDSKKFENHLQKVIISIACKHCPDVDDAMDDSQVLEQIFLEDYAQQLYVKGNLSLELEAKRLELSDYKYGVTLNSKTLKHVKILPEQSINRIVTIENKANFESSEIEEGTLFIFTHGFFSPKERDFLVNLRNVLYSESELKGNNKATTFLHSSDLDYGGIRIFKYIRKKVFPEIQPFMMDSEIYRKYRDLGYGTPIELQTLEKLKKLKEPLLQELIDSLVAERYGIEQECFLMI
ncbi:Wadjet anti-phage system protein JetD domain-containing protein [Sinanaerobacter chloroacetimidivorans]|uniref:Wadjet protein JetD C-terminal domain-containing protein n=1 Tax=Sinanaerobacter chloroacetimidivorans TaxID=2818044 RepID=A0A8J7VZC3_9FIRM|nr:Wadjet anti-phage system protein JetD domain-containing protein [Sinanaerobacter chloroacetimidivorans]MBR0597484.1 hypothetical protein [Sinanaerobacter chloroacetimidivorans]